MFETRKPDIEASDVRFVICFKFSGNKVSSFLQFRYSRGSKLFFLNEGCDIYV